MDKLEILLSNYFSDEDTQKIRHHFELIILEPDEVFIPTKSKSGKLGFTLDGILKAVETLNDHQYAILYFVEKNHFVSEAHNYYQHLPSVSSIVAATRCTLLHITLSQLDALEEEIPALKAVRAGFSEQEMFYIMKAMGLFKKTEGRDRYLAFLTQYPNLSRCLSVKDVASYLGMTPNYLSRIRAEVLRNEKR